MTAASAQFHEAAGDPRAETRDRHRAIVSLMEELDAVDWYDQRIDATGDTALRDILRHNRDEEKEHAAMLLERVRRHDPTWDAPLRRYLFTEGPITDRAPKDTPPPDERDADDLAPSLPIGPHTGKEML